MPTAVPPAADPLYEAAPCGLLVAGPQGELLHANTTLCRWLGYEREELVGRLRFEDLLTVGGRIFHQTHLAPLLRMQGFVAEVKLEFLRKDTSTVPVIVNAAERLAGTQQQLHVAALVAEDRDKYERELLLQRRRAEQLLAQHEQDQHDLAAARAQAEDRALFAEQMVGIVSHDLRNPLSAVHMSATLLGMGELTQQQKLVVERITRSVGRAQRLISDLLDFTQARLGGGLAVQPSRVDLHALIGEAVAEWSVAFSDRRIVHEQVGACDALADADRIVEAAGNLVANAVRYGRQDQPVTVTTAPDASGRVRISVHNMGQPIPPELLPKIFEPMVRGAAATGGRGVGLGLYIVRAVAQAHEGSVSVSSSEAGGTTFTLHLPAA